MFRTWVDLLINVAILVSLLSFGNQILREFNFKSSNARSGKIWAGILYGIFGCILVLYSMQRMRGYVVDMPLIPVILAGLYSSFPSAVIASVVIGLFRIVVMGMDPISMMNLIIGIIVAVGCGLISKITVTRQKQWFLTAVLVYLVFLLINSWLFPNIQTVNAQFVTYLVGIIIVAFIMYYFMEYMLLTNEAYLRMKDAADRDYLTGLNNVRRFDQLMDAVMERAREHNTNLNILFIDVDHFKRINDTYGHPEGDRVLMQLSELLTKLCRPQDIVSRNGGEEFSMILADCSLVEARDIAERIRSGVEQHPFCLQSGEEINITISIGVSSYPYTTLDVEKLVEQSDMALYKAKREGRNRVVVAG